MRAPLYATRAVATAMVAGAPQALVWGLERDAFLLTITGSPQAVADARERAEAMLSGDRARG